MSYSNRLIILFCLLFSSCAHALEFIFDTLYWRATESFDWVLINDRNPPHQNITYKTTMFHYEPGFRIGMSSRNDWDGSLFYTRYHTNTHDSVGGKVTPGLLASKIDQPSGQYYFQSGQIDFTLNYNVIDVDLSKRFYFKDSLIIRPLIGLRGSWIDQSIHTILQGQLSVSENLENNFLGVGPKTGIEGTLNVFRTKNYHFNLIANFATSYLWGHWSIKDELTDSEFKMLMINNKSRNQGALAFQSMLGLNLDYQNFSIKLGYEISDWFNQFQIFDDGTGGHSNSLVLQGGNLSLSYAF